GLVRKSFIVVSLVCNAVAGCYPHGSAGYNAYGKPAHAAVPACPFLRTRIVRPSHAFCRAVVPLFDTEEEMRYLHTMLRVSNLEQSLDFFCDKLGFVKVRRMENEAGRFTLVYLAAPEDLARSQAEKSPEVEL